jgi:glycosyltransferase involved in cell wall biosynthesis
MAGGGELFNQIKAQAPSNVRLLGWVDAADVIPAADIFLSTSLNEGVPYSLLEVLSAGVPIVAVESGAIAEIIQARVNGFLTSKKPTEIVPQIESLFADSVQRIAIGKSALSFTIAGPKKNNMVLAHLSVYSKDAKQVKI